MNLRLILILLLSSTLSTAFGQAVSEQKQASNILNLAHSPTTKNPTPDYKTFKQAERLWKNGDYEEAEKLYIQAYNNGGYVLHLAPLAKAKFEMGDIKGANTLYDLLIKEYAPSLDGFAPGNKTLLYTYCFQQINFNFKIGNPEVGIAKTLEFVDILGEKVSEIERNYFSNTYTSASEAAFALEDRASLVKLQERASKIENGKSGEFIASIHLNVLDKDFEKALNRIDDIQKNGGGFLLSKAVSRFYLPLVYTYMGENEKAIEVINKFKRNVLINNGAFEYMDGLIALNQKKYQEAVETFTDALKGYMFLYYKVEPVGKYRHYTKRAEAYLGMGDFVMAKKDYESALAYNSTYEPALNGIAMLEGRMVSERQTDKTPPVITLTEPSVNRGLKIVATTEDVMVKGKAIDPAGLKSVTINGETVYSQETGDFWGSVALKEGTNSIVVVAVDHSDNTSEQVFEIERPAQLADKAVKTSAEAGKEGKNFALLIASQNYDDSMIPSLEKPIPDAVRLKLILKNNYNFHEENIVTLFNPERSDFKKKFISISETLQPEDNLIIFYAGHGIWVDKEKKGYWLLTDAKRNDVNTWLPNKEVLDMIAGLPARHTLLITDACFSGSVFKTRGLGADAPVALQEMSNKISRVAITSGNDTEVPDESVFMKHLVKALSENKEPYLTAQKMFINHIIEAVMTESKTEPRYGTLESAGHIGGDYIFSKK